MKSLPMRLSDMRLRASQRFRLGQVLCAQPGSRRTALRHNAQGGCMGWLCRVRSGSAPVRRAMWLRAVALAVEDARLKCKHEQRFFGWES